MPTPINVGTTSFRAVSIEETVSKSSMDSLTVTLKGAASGLSTELAMWTRGKIYPGYSTMFLESKSSVDRGPVAEITLNFSGFLETTATENGLIDVEDSISRQSVTLNTSDDENVSFQYYAQSTTARWIYRGADMPRSPRFKATVPSSIPTNYLFQPDPPNYTGSIAGRYDSNGRLPQFWRSSIAPGFWAVVEQWEILIEPTTE